MTLRTVTLRLPTRLYQQIKQRAYETRRSVEDELVSTVRTSLIATDDLVGIHPDIATGMAQLTFLDDHHLWRAAQQVVPLEKSECMQALTLKQQAEGLTQSEQEEAEQLRHFAHRVMLVRAEAAVLLKKRGLEAESQSACPGAEAVD